MCDLRAIHDWLVPRGIEANHAPLMHELLVAIFT